MWTWLAIALLVLLGPRLLRVWAQHRGRVNLLHLPLFHAAYAEAAPEAFPSGLRDALTAASSELRALGFEQVGFIQSPEFGVAPPRIFAVLRHPGELSFAVVSFAIGDRKAVSVDFETLFTDGWWLRTINRRAHFILAPHATGRTADPYVATLREQWSYHRDAVAFETTRVRRDVRLADLARHRNAVDDDENTAALRHGFFRIPDDGKGFRFTPLGADTLIQHHADAAKRLATAPPLIGVLAMRAPADDLERMYHNILFVNRQGPKPRPGLVFLLSAVAFAASAMLFKQWTWLLWLIPFLLLHELGHWSAMRLFGHRDARIRFIPFLGAATLTTTQFRKLSHEMIVLLAGPVPGIVLGFVLLQVVDFARNPYAFASAITLIAINAVNLLPLHPLDGGRILHALVTAGRPHVDVALKAIAGALFVAGAIALRDPTLAILAAVGLLLVRPGLRLARMDNEIRRRPGFGPGLTPEERRRLIFAALPDPPPNEGGAWVPLVQQLEVSLSHGAPRLWPALPWGLVYAGCLGGLVAWGASIFSTFRTVTDCPPRSRAMPLACDAPATSNDIDWTRRDRKSIARNPLKLYAPADYPYAAFLWCTGRTPAIDELVLRFREVRATADFCPALPWEPLPPETRTAREAARKTLGLIALGERSSKAVRLAYLDMVTSHDTPRTKLDEETIRLYKASLDEGSDGDAHRRLRQRIGPSPGESCKHLRFINVATHFGGGDASETDDDTSEDGDAGIADADDGGPTGVSAAPHDEARVPTTRLSVLLASPADLAPLRRALCDAGCQVDVLPAGSTDPRLRVCF
jgi:Zn-dependent protease